MPTYIALLRALNVGGRYFRMQDLRACLTASGLEDVETYIQTGNVRFTTRMRSAGKVEKHVEEALAAACGFDVPAVLFTPGELSRVYADALGIEPPEFAAEGKTRRYVTFFKQPPPSEQAREVAAWDEPGESAVVIGRACHIWIEGPTMEARFFKAFKKVLAPGTNRDLKVVATLAERWGT